MKGRRKKKANIDDVIIATSRVVCAAKRWKKVFSFEIEPKPGIRYEENRRRLLEKVTDELFEAVEELEEIS